MEVKPAEIYLITGLCHKETFVIRGRPESSYPSQ